jgi:hypothetical protein
VSYKADKRSQFHDERQLFYLFIATMEEVLLTEMQFDELQHRFVNICKRQVLARVDDNFFAGLLLRLAMPGLAMLAYSDRLVICVTAINARLRQQVCAPRSVGHTSRF